MAFGKFIFMGKVLKTGDFGLKSSDFKNFEKNF